jgi:hypothetical protein
MIQRLALSGLLRAGKDYVAEQAGYKIFSFAEPLYALCRHAFGSCDKANPDHRRFLILTGQWGRDEHNDETPDSVERACFTIMARRYGGLMTNMAEIRWSEFGTRKDFWIQAMIQRLTNEGRDQRAAVTNARFANETAALKQCGFAQYLVACSKITRIERNGGPISEEIDNSHSERYARELYESLPDEQIIWNDHRPMPPDRKFLTVPQFLEIAR